PACTQLGNERYCVQCVSDEDCGLGGTCDTVSLSCSGGFGLTPPEPCIQQSDCDAGITDYDLKCDQQSGLCIDSKGKCDNVTAFCKGGGECVDLMEVLTDGGGGQPIPGGMGGGGATLPGYCECEGGGGLEDLFGGLLGGGNEVCGDGICLALGDVLSFAGGGGGGGGGGLPPPPPVKMIVVQSNASTYVSEDETTDTFTVALDTEPTANVVVLVSGGDITELTLAPAALIFTATDWNIPQTVTVTGVDDVLFDGIKVTYINIAVFDAVSADEYGAAPSISILVDTYDNEVAGYTVVESGGSTVVSEDGDTDSFTVVLDERPGSNVTFSVASQDQEEGLVSPFTLTFTASNWDTPQTVVVTGVNDGLDDGDQDFLVVVSVDDNQSDSAFTALSDTPVSAVNLDNDEDPVDEPVEEEEVEDVLPACAVGFGSLVESEGSTVMSESGSSDSFTFALGSEPAGNVVVSVASSDLSEAVVSSSTLTFTASNWDTPQTVVVTGVNDGLSDGDQAVDVTLSAAGFEPVVVGVINADND
ncbi:MAG: hypothetical protein CL468_04215, partial [Acidimicrobiaceae bacterium]|nr:hypothetical protein [Acidimicrobiaceae bacterium]